MMLMGECKVYDVNIDSSRFLAIMKMALTYMAHVDIICVYDVVS